MTRALLSCVLLAASSLPPAAAQAPSGQMTATITSYCLRGIGRAGVPVGPGTVAVDMAVIPLWSSVQIEGLDEIFTALDTGGGVKNNHVDLWLGDCDSAIQWGRQTRQVWWWP